MNQLFSKETFCFTSFTFNIKVSSLIYLQFKNNISYNIGTHHLLVMTYPASYRPSSFSMGFDALDNFRLAFCLLVPGGWILAQLLLFLYYYLDNAPYSTSGHRLRSLDLREPLAYRIRKPGGLVWSCLFLGRLVLAS